jgi:cell pole-organizing protein PopZ
MADNTASLVVALSAQLTKFEADMKKAGVLADQGVSDIENKFSKMSPKISTSFFGNLFSNLATRGLDLAVKAVTELIDRFGELEKVAKYADLSLNFIYGLQEVGSKAGAAIGDINTAVKAVAFSLDEMKRGGDNALKTLLDANPQFLKGVNRDALTLTQTLGIVSNIIREAKNEIQAIDIAKNLGIPDSAVKAMQAYGGDLAKAADAAGKMAPDLQKLADVNKQFGELFTAVWNGIKTEIVDGVIPEFKKAITDLIQWMEWLQKAFVGGPLDMTNAISSLKQFELRMNTPAQVPTRVQVTGGTAGTAADPFAHKATGGDTASAYERETNAINKEIATMQAQNATLGESAHAPEEYRVQLVLSEKAAQDGKEFTQALNDEIAVTAERAATAKQALAEHTFAIQRLNSASQQVGSALSTAFADAIVEGKSLNDVVSSLIKTLEKAAINALVMNLFTPGAGGTTAPLLGALGIGHAAGGTDFARGGLTLVGEQGPELVNLPRGAQVIPNDVARNMSGNSGAIVYSPAIDARGASVEAVARLAAVMEADRASFASRTVATIQMARRGRVPGL